MKSLRKISSAIRYSLLGLAFAVIAVPGVVNAASGQLVSGPNGAQANGWFSVMPTFTVNTVPGCPSGSHTFTLGNWGGEGLHHITLRSYDNDHPTLDALDDHNGTGTNEATWICTAASAPAMTADPVIFWEGNIKWDSTAPGISLTGPSNNANTGNSSAQVTGDVSDSTSGVWKVVVNGVVGSISGGSFSASVPLKYGLNTLTATVYDNAGNASSGQVVVNRLENPANADDTSTTSSRGNSSAVGSAQSQGTTGSTNSETAKTNDGKAESAKPIQTSLVKTVVKTGGISIAAMLGILAFLLILDKAGIIEIRVLPSITKKLNTGLASVRGKK